MLVGRHDHAAPRARIDVDVRIHAALADEPELVQLVEQRGADLRSLADKDQRFGVFQALGERVGLLDMVIPDFDLMAVQASGNTKASSVCRSSRRES